MQAQQSMDPRFRIDAKFVDDNKDEEGDKEGLNTEGDDDAENEREWQMNILEQVVGTKLDSVKSANNKKNKKMLRYDPSKDDHQKFERIREGVHIKKERKTKDAVEFKNEQNAASTVSKEVFYVVTDTLQQSLRSRGEGFSLLDMFGKADQLDQRDEQLKQLENEKILVNNKQEKLFTVNPFSYDSSSESESEEVTKDQAITGSKESDKANAKNAKISNKKLKIATESFFIPKNDARLKGKHYSLHLFSFVFFLYFLF